MKNTYLFAIAMVFMSLMLTSCELIGDIFGAGVYTGIFLVVAVIVVIVIIVVRAGKKN